MLVRILMLEVYGVRFAYFEFSVQERALMIESADYTSENDDGLDS